MTPPGPTRRRLAMIGAVIGLAGIASVVAMANGLGRPERAEASAARSRAATPLRAAFYDSDYPADWARLGSHYVPSKGYYSEDSVALVRRQIAAMSVAGIRAGIAGWDGPGTVSDRRMSVLLRAAHGTSFRWSVEVRGRPSAAAISGDLARLGRVARDPAYLRVGSRFVVFVAGSGASCQSAERWTGADRAGAYLMLQAFSGDRRCAHQPAGWYVDDPARSEASALPFSYTISAGDFQATRSTPALARDLVRFDHAVRDMVASEARFQLIASFNRWAEGSAVESAKPWASSDGEGSYIDALRTNGTQPPPSPPPPGPVGPSPVPTPTATLPPPSPNDPVLAAAGDIACDPTDRDYFNGQGNGVDCQELATSNLLGQIPNLAAVAALGDTQYEVGSYAAFLASFDPTWGRFKAIMHPAIGNHEYSDAKGAGYFQYFGAAAGTPGQGWYSYDVGTWHVIVLDANCPGQNGCGLGGPQETWLRNDLTAHPALCTLAYWHQPRFSSGEHGNNPQLDPLWRDLYAAGVEIVLSGHDHDYERFAPQTPDALPDPLHGIREFVVGTGGRNHYGFVTLQPNSEVRNADTFGVLALTLHPASYDWRFIPEAGKTFTDSGTDTCHGPNGPLP